MNTQDIQPAEPLLAIVEAARHVLRHLRPGLGPQAYLRALAIEMEKWQFPYETNKVFDVYYDAHLVDIYLAPLVVDRTVLVDVRVNHATDPAWPVHALGVLELTCLPQALLLNFHRPELEWIPIQRPVPARRR